LPDDDLGDRPVVLGGGRDAAVLDQLIAGEVRLGGGGVEDCDDGADQEALGAGDLGGDRLTVARGGDVDDRDVVPLDGRDAGQELDEGVAHRARDARVSHGDHLAVDHAGGGPGDPYDGAGGQAAHVVLDHDAGRAGGGQQVPRDVAAERLVEAGQQGHRQHRASCLIENDNQHAAPSRPE